MRTHCDIQHFRLTFFPKFFPIGFQTPQGVEGIIPVRSEVPMGTHHLQSYDLNRFEIFRPSILWPWVRGRPSLLSRHPMSMPTHRVLGPPVLALSASSGFASIPLAGFDAELRRFVLPTSVGQLSFPATLHRRTELWICPKPYPGSQADHSKNSPMELLIINPY